jgi:hypothetical protein
MIFSELYPCMLLATSQSAFEVAITLPYPLRRRGSLRLSLTQFPTGALRLTHETIEREQQTIAAPTTTKTRKSKAAC